MRRHTLSILFISFISCFTTNASLSVPSEHLYHAFSDETYFLNWTADGQLKTIAAPCRGYIRNHKWNEAGQLAAVVDNNHCGFYAYDGNGERVYKLTGASLVRQINGGTLISASHFDDAVMYVNPYVVISPKGYHKFYYNGSQRIASSISKTSLNFAPNHILHLDSFAIKGRANAQSYYAAILNTAEELQNDIDETYYSLDGWGYDQLQWECTDEEEWTIQNYAVSDSNIIKKTLKFFPIHQPILQEQRYFYHTDHLGSSSWITDSLGMPIQFIHYQPYGELYINYKTTAYDERFKFTGKERDAETDYDYFGARYYASICPSFISVDPLADNYPGLNPYAYCGWNPVMYVDPDGKRVQVLDVDGVIALYNTIDKSEHKYINIDQNGYVITNQDYAKYSNSNNYKALSELVKSDINYTIEITDELKYKNEMGNIISIEMGPINVIPNWGKDAFGFDTNETGWLGLTQTPGISVDKYASIDNDVHIIINSSLSEEGKAQTLSHELYGHALLFQRKQPHTHNIQNLIEQNDLLRYAISISILETKKNMRKK